MATLYEEVRATLGESEFRPRKRLGQNFLIHENIIASIVQLLNLAPEDEIVEIGPGLGFLTRRLVSAAKKVWAVEIDSALVDRLNRSSIGSHPAFQLIHNDILKVAPEDFLPPHKVKLVGNLPYSISTPVLFRLFDWREHFSSLVLMMQKEVADRIASGPGTKAYGTLICLVPSPWTNFRKSIGVAGGILPQTKSEIDDSKDRSLPRATDSCKRASFAARACTCSFRPAAQDLR